MILGDMMSLLVLTDTGRKLTFTFSFGLGRYGTMTTPFGSYKDVHLMPNGTVPYGTIMFNGL